MLNAFIVAGLKTGAGAAEIVAELKTSRFGGCALGTGLVDIPGVTVLGCALSLAFRLR
jgi:hypothetical protein